MAEYDFMPSDMHTPDTYTRLVDPVDSLPAAFVEKLDDLLEEGERVVWCQSSRKFNGLQWILFVLLVCLVGGGIAITIIVWKSVSSSIWVAVGCGVLGLGWFWFRQRMLLRAYILTMKHAIVLNSPNAKPIFTSLAKLSKNVHEVHARGTSISTGKGDVVYFLSSDGSGSRLRSAGNTDKDGKGKGEGGDDTQSFQVQGDLMTAIPIFIDVDDVKDVVRSFNRLLQTFTRPDASLPSRFTYVSERDTQGQSGVETDVSDSTLGWSMMNSSNTARKDSGVVEMTESIV